MKNPVKQVVSKNRKLSMTMSMFQESLRAFQLLSQSTKHTSGSTYHERLHRGNLVQGDLITCSFQAVIKASGDLPRYSGGKPPSSFWKPVGSNSLLGQINLIESTSLFGCGQKQSENYLTVAKRLMLYPLLPDHITTVPG